MLIDIPTKIPIHPARDLDERVARLLTRLRTHYTGDPAAVRVVRVPLRIAPLGAHIDHQLGRVMGMAVDRAILLAFAPTQNGTVSVESADFPQPVRFALASVPPKVAGDWGNYVRGAALALQRDYSLPTGFIGALDSDMPIGGLSSSAAVTIAYLLALEVVNGLAVTPVQNIELVSRTERGYIGLNNGILDQSVILCSQRNSLTVIDCQAVQIEQAPAATERPDFELLAVYSGVTQALMGTSYNNRVAECQAAARQLLALAGQPAPAEARLRQVEPAIFAEYGAQLPEPLRRRATHYFSEMARMALGEIAWRQGDLQHFGALMTESGASSIHNYEAGSPQLITLYEILAATPGVYGTRFSGAGFRGSCLALINPTARQQITEAVHGHYPAAHPAEAIHYSLHFCQPADGAALFPINH